MYCAKPSFLLNTRADLAVVEKYHEKYSRIDAILDKNPEILEAVHADLRNKMGSLKGREADYSSEMLFRMLLIKCIEQLSFRDLVVRVNDSSFLRNFARIGWGEVMNFTVLDAAWKCLDDTTWDVINEYLFKYASREDLISGTDLRTDSTVCESNIHFPTDSSLLWDCYRVIARTMRQIEGSNNKYSMYFRFHDKKIKKLHTFISTQAGRKQLSTIRNVKRAMKLLVERVEDLINKGALFIAHAREMRLSQDCIEPLELLLENAQYVTEQARRHGINGEMVSAKERLFSIFEEHAELLKRGKAQKPVEFGHLVTLAQTREKFISYYAIDEISTPDTEQKDKALENHKKQFGVYPERFTADKNYHVSVEDTHQWEKKVSVFSVGKKGNRSLQETEREHSEPFRMMQRFRAGCEGSISVLKRAFGLRRSLYRGFKSFASSICRLVFCHNLVLLATK